MTAPEGFNLRRRSGPYLQLAGTPRSAQGCNCLTVASPELVTRFKHAVQELLCDGCCCGGGTTQGYLPMPFAAPQQRWLARKWHLHLAPCHCLGLCDVTNVVYVLDKGTATWFSNLESQKDYAAVLNWAAGTNDAPSLLELPERLGAKRFKRFTTPQ